jgi:hypothetical protein
MTSQKRRELFTQGQELSLVHIDCDFIWSVRACRVDHHKKAIKQIQPKNEESKAILYTIKDNSLLD